MQRRVMITVEVCHVLITLDIIFDSDLSAFAIVEYIDFFRIAIAYFIKIDLRSERTVKRVVYVRIACVVSLSFEISLSNWTESERERLLSWIHATLMKLS